MATARDRMLTLLQTRAFCDDCVAQQLAFTQRQQANQIGRGLDQDRLIRREKATCGGCGHTKIVNHAIGAHAQQAGVKVIGSPVEGEGPPTTGLLRTGALEQVAHAGGVASSTQQPAVKVIGSPVDDADSLTGLLTVSTGALEAVAHAPLKVGKGPAPAAGLSPAAEASIGGRDCLAAGALVGGRFRLERELNRGGMATVWVADDLRFGCKRAVKIAGAMGTWHDTFQARFEREARLGDLLGNQTGIVRAVDWGEVGDGGRLFLALDLIDGARPLDVSAGSIEERMRRFEEACERVAAVHARGVVHRDLKPANFLQAREGTVWLTDFGLAKRSCESDPRERSASVTQVGEAWGTAPYMPPEQFEDFGSVDARADVFALGVILYQMLTGHLPFPGQSHAEVQRVQVRVEAGQLPAPSPRMIAPSVPAAVDLLCAATLAFDRAARPADAGVLLVQLRSALASPDPTAAKASAWGASVKTKSSAWGASVKTKSSAWGASVKAILPPVPPVANPTPSPPSGWRAGLRLPWDRGPQSLPTGIRWGDRDGEYVNEADRSILLWVPSGEFDMGSTDTASEQPVHRVTLARGFFLAKSPVTAEQYGRFCAATTRTTPQSFGDDHPVVNVNWHDATAYCAWAGLRLPTEAEWEYAARGTDGRTYPWGNDPPTDERATINWQNSTAAVGSCPQGASPFGVLDMAGNVWEWVQDHWAPDYENAHRDGRAWKAYERVYRDGRGWETEKTGASRVYRGGSWINAATACRATARGRSGPEDRQKVVGFRPARDA